MIAATDRDMMMRALALAERGLFTTTPNPRVGCVIARDGLVLGEGWHERAGEAHAEIRALEDARTRGNDVRGATVYVTLEPCNHQGRTPPCTAALIEARPARVVVAIEDPDRRVGGNGLDALRKAGIEVTVGVEVEAARRLNRFYLKQRMTGMPWVTVK